VKVEITQKEAAVIGRALDEYCDRHPEESESHATLAWVFAPKELTAKAFSRIDADASNPAKESQ
jgi:phosphopantetheinyl transferase (holo-ACP synthase)